MCEVERCSGETVADALIASAGRDSMQRDEGELATIPRAAIPENS
jgi:hypothetical protein